VFGSGGKESPWDATNDPSLEDSFWEGGLAFDAGEKLSAEFAIGERSFGSSWRGEVDYTFRRGNVRLSYSEDPTTVGYDREALPGATVGIGSSGDPDDFLTLPGRIESFIAERLDFRYELQLRRTSFNFVVFDENRVNRFDANRVALTDQEQSGVSASVAWQLGVRTELVAAGSAVNRKDSVTADSDFRRATLTANYMLGQKTRLSFAYDYSEQQPKTFSSDGDFVVNTVSLLLLYSF
jgi:hypothetical protein